MDRWYYGELIHAPYPGVIGRTWTCRIDVPGGGKRLVADTLAGIKALIREEKGIRR